MLHAQLWPLELARETFPERVITEGDSFNVTYNVTDNGNPAVSLPPSWRFNELALMENGRVIITEYGLQFVNVSSENNGTYVATFNNTAGTTTFTLTFSQSVSRKCRRGQSSRLVV